MSRFSEKQMLLMTIGGFFAVIAGLGATAYSEAARHIRSRV